MANVNVEVEMKALQVEHGLYRSKAVDFKFEKNPYKHYKYEQIPFDVVYLVNATSSMDTRIQPIKNYCIDISNLLKEDKIYDFRFDAVFYRDPIDMNHSDKNIFIDLTNNVKNFQKFIEEIKSYGGGDGPEDWFDCYNLALNKMSWRKNYSM